MTTDTSERGLEGLICSALTGSPCDPGASHPEEIADRPAGYGAGWICADPNDYDREYCVDLRQLAAFLHENQPDALDALDDVQEVYTYAVIEDD